MFILITNSQVENALCLCVYAVRGSVFTPLAPPVCSRLWELS